MPDHILYLPASLEPLRRIYQTRVRDLVNPRICTVSIHGEDIKATSSWLCLVGSKLLPLSSELQQCYPLIVSSQPYPLQSRPLVRFSMYLSLIYISPLPLRIAVVTNIAPPASQGVWNDPANALDLTGTDTDTATIVSTVNIVDQKAGATGDPDQPIPDTAITAVDGQLTNGTSSRRRSTGYSRRSASDYDLVFSGTGTGPNDRDGSIEGTAYLTFTLVPNSTYNVDACLAFCDSVELCGSLFIV